MSLNGPAFPGIVPEYVERCVKLASEEFCDDDWHILLPPGKPSLVLKPLEQQGKSETVLLNPSFVDYLEITRFQSPMTDKLLCCPHALHIDPHDFAIVEASSILRESI
jgi:hypothetical protein